MPYNITQLKADLEGIGHGTTISQITNINGLINRAARQLLLDVDPQETKRIVELGAQLFQDVYNYPLPVDVKGNKVIDLFPQVRRSSRDQFQQQYNEEFDVYKNKTRTPIFTINFDTSVKTIRIAKSFVVPIQTNIAESITENGTWAVGGGAQSLVDDSINFVAGTGSIRFTLDSGSTTGYIENSTMASVNLERDVDQGVEFVWVYMPSPDLITDVTLRWGSSSANYWQNTVTTAWDGTAFQTGWNQLGFEWEDATEVGTPDDEDVTYLRLGFTYDNSDGDIQNMRINDFTSSLGTILNIEYYSKYLFRDATTGAYQETVTDNTNLINLDTESYNLLTYQCALLMAQQQQGADSGFDYTFFKKEYDAALARYKAMYKSEIIKPKTAYYKRTNNNYRRWFGNGPMGGASGY